MVKNIIFRYDRTIYSTIYKAIYHNILSGQCTTAHRRKVRRIYQAAIGTSPLAGYSRSIWMYYKGQDIRMNLTLPNGQSNPRSRDIDHDISVVSKIYPNPTSLEFNIEVKGLKEKSYSYQIFTFEGSLIETGSNLKNKQTIKTNHFPIGVYFCKIYDEKGIQIGLHKLNVLR